MHPTLKIEHEFQKLAEAWVEQLKPTLDTHIRAIHDRIHRERMRMLDRIAMLSASDMHDGCVAAPLSREDWDLLTAMVLEQVDFSSTKGGL